jgi:ankyrin repeat protein
MLRHNFYHDPGPTQRLVKSIQANDIATFKIAMRFNFGRFNLNQLVDGETALHHAVRAGNLEMLSQLVLRRAEIKTLNRQGLSAIALAEQLGKRECLQHFAMLCHDHTLDHLDTYRLRPFKSQKHTSPVIQPVPFIREADKPKLEFSKRQEAEKVEAVIVANPRCIDSKDAHGNTLMHNAVMNWNEHAIRKLLLYDAGMTIHNGFLLTPIKMAARMGYTEALEIFTQLCNPCELLEDDREILNIHRASLEAKAPPPCAKRFRKADKHGNKMFDETVVDTQEREPMVCQSTGLVLP